jgi:hypothetical protein
VARELGVPQREALDDVPLAVSGRAGSQVLYLPRPRLLGRRRECQWCGHDGAGLEKLCAGVVQGASVGRDKHEVT